MQYALSSSFFWILLDFLFVFGVLGWFISFDEVGWLMDFRIFTAHRGTHPWPQDGLLWGMTCVVEQNHFLGVTGSGERSFTTTVVVTRTSTCTRSTGDQANCLSPAATRIVYLCARPIMIVARSGSTFTAARDSGLLPLVALRIHHGVHGFSFSVVTDV